MLLARQELQSEDLLELATVELGWRGPIEAIQRHTVLEARLQQVAFERLAVAALERAFGRDAKALAEPAVAEARESSRPLGISPEPGDNRLRRSWPSIPTSK